MDQGQPGFYKKLGHDHAVEFRARPHLQCEVLPDFGEPSEVATGGNELGGTTQLADRAVHRHGTHAVLQLRDVGVNVLDRHMRPACAFDRSKPRRSRKSRKQP